MNDCILFYERSMFLSFYDMAWPWKNFCILKMVVLEIEFLKTVTRDQESYMGTYLTSKKPPGY